MNIEELKQKYAMDVSGDEKAGMNRWLRGYVDGYSWEGVVFKEKSTHGINGGRISKLHVRNKDNKVIANYDRGWDVRPVKPEDKKAVEKILAKYK